MLKRLTPREQFEQLISGFEPLIRKAFEDAVADIRSNVQLRRIIERLERNDIIGAIDALNIDRAAFNPVEDAIRQAFNAGGTAAVGGMPALRDPEGHRLIIRFDVRNLGAERWLAEHSSTLVANIAADMREAARVALTAGMEAGRNPRATALDVVGRLNRATGRREGGILGLTSTQTEYVASMRQRLLSGDPAEMRKVLSMTRRDKRFDKTILKAIAEGKPVPADMVARMTGRYSDSLLLLRGETIARTESMAALGQSQEDAFQQAIDKGTIRADQIEGTWHTAGDKRVRDSHEGMDGQKVGWKQPFRSPSGALLLHPGDTSLGAGPAEVCNCRCWRELKVNFFAGLE